MVGDDANKLNHQNFATNELDKGELREMRARLGGRRKQLTRHMQKKNNKGGGGGKRKAAEEGKMGDVSKRKK